MRISMLKTLLAALLPGGYAFAQCGVYNVPYGENFQTITANNTLPACWAADNFSNSALTFTGAGSWSHAAFNYTPAGSTHFYSPAIFLKAGVTYSVRAFYWVSSSTGSGWSDFSILHGTAQSSVGMQVLASTSSPPTNALYQPLSSTFSVAVTGSYYFGIRGTSSGTGIAQYLMWDEFSIIIPCNVSPNQPTLSVNPSSLSICPYDNTTTLSASGAGTYLWNNGATTASVIASSLGNFAFLIGTDTLSGCSATLSNLQVTVQPLPQVYLSTSNTDVCSGSTVSLKAIQAPESFGLSLVWSTGGTGTIVTVSPTVQTLYSFTATSAEGCTLTAAKTVSVRSLPEVQVAGADTVCLGKEVTFSASGASSYTWNAGSQMVISNTLALTPDSSLSISVAGVDLNGCRDTAFHQIAVIRCDGLPEGDPGMFSVFPIPLPKRS